MAPANAKIFWNDRDGSIVATTAAEAGAGKSLGCASAKSRNN
jgi:hypothetical protein